MATLPIVHVEITASDPAAASKFYADLCGWKIDVDANFNYYQFAAEGGPGGGFPKADGQTYKPGDVIVYVGADDVNAFLKRVEELGGKVLLPETPIPGFGSYAFFADPGGTRMGVFSQQA